MPDKKPNQKSMEDMTTKDASLMNEVGDEVVIYKTHHIKTF